MQTGQSHARHFTIPEYDLAAACIGLSPISALRAATARSGTAASGSLWLWTAVRAPPVRISHGGRPAFRSLRSSKRQSGKCAEQKRAAVCQLLWPSGAEKIARVFVACASRRRTASGHLFAKITVASPGMGAFLETCTSCRSRAGTGGSFSDSEILPIRSLVVSPWLSLSWITNSRQ